MPPANRVWTIELTYIRFAERFVYVTRIIKWYSRKSFSWEHSLAMDKPSAFEALERAKGRYGTRETFKPEQGVQFASPAFLKPLKNSRVRISMDGKGALAG